MKIVDNVPCARKTKKVFWLLYIVGTLLSAFSPRARKGQWRHLLHGSGGANGTRLRDTTAWRILTFPPKSRFAASRKAHPSCFREKIIFIFTRRERRPKNLSGCRNGSTNQIAPRSSRFDIARDDSKITTKRVSCFAFSWRLQGSTWT
jgi:hypothetical protein